MENLCLIASEYGHVGFNEEGVYLIKDIHFTKFTSHDKKNTDFRKCKKKLLEKEMKKHQILKMKFRPSSKK